MQRHLRLLRLPPLLLLPPPLRPLRPTNGRSRRRACCSRCRHRSRRGSRLQRQARLPMVLPHRLPVTTLLGPCLDSQVTTRRHSRHMVRHREASTLPLAHTGSSSQGRTPRPQGSMPILRRGSSQEPIRRHPASSRVLTHRPLGSSQVLTHQPQGSQGSSTPASPAHIRRRLLASRPAVFTHRLARRPAPTLRRQVSAPAV